MKQLVSMAKAAERLGVSERTVQRYVSSGQLSWHGEKRRGCNAVGIVVRELAAILRSSGADARPRRTRRPVGERILKAMRPVEAGSTLDPALSSRAVEMLIRAIIGGACQDLSYFGIWEVCRGNHLFAAVLTGQDIRAPKAMDPLAYYAAGKLAQFVARVDALCSQEEAHQDPMELVAVLAHLWRSMTTPQVNVVIRFDTTTRRASLDVTPVWLDDAPGGALPFAQRDTHTRLYQNADYRAANRYATKAALHLLGGASPGVPGEGFGTRLQLLLQNADAGARRSLREEADDEGNLSARQRAEARHHKTVKTVWLRQEYGLSQSEFAAIQRMAARLRGDTLDRAPASYKDKARQYSKGGGSDESQPDESDESQPARRKNQKPQGHSMGVHRPSLTAVGRMLGVSRQAASEMVSLGQVLLRRGFLGGLRLGNRPCQDG
jgi:hypothetical protein